ncbi:MAG: glycosyltransferase family 1 protein [Prosthecochloris sp.]|nr:glycosyltransferase family 1 protein [Prosthecochloris sp.]
MMHIGIEGQRIFRHNKHGMDFVALELIRAIDATGTGDRLTVFASPGEDSGCLQGSENLTIRQVNGGFYPAWEQISLPGAVRHAGCNLLHCTSNTAPLWSPVPLVITIHDVIYLEQQLAGQSNPNLYQKLGNRYRKAVVPAVARLARHVITVSTYEKGRLLDALDLPEERVSVVYNGVGSHFHPSKQPAELERIRREYRLPEAFMLFLGNTDPKKNLSNVLKAYSIYVRSAARPLPILILDYDADLFESINARLNLRIPREQVLLPGYIPNSRLPALYEMSSLFLYPSLRESFGIPVLEAMACGTPVVTSTVTSMPEVAGDAAILVDPSRPEEIAEGITRALENSHLREELRRKGFIRAAGFTWKRAAQQVLDIYHMCLETASHQ